MALTIHSSATVSQMGLTLAGDGAGLTCGGSAVQGRLGMEASTELGSRGLDPPGGG
ncbi:hypothetical protein ACXC9Q_30335 [Kribbella sp. CWNU-51]